MQEGDAQRVFLLLIRSDAINYIRDLQRAGFTDDDLPVIRRKSKDGSAVFIHKRLVNDNSANTEEKILTCFLGWDESKLEVFFENQWVFLTPVFTPEKFAYVFHSQCPLPYMPLQHSDTSPNQENSDTIRDLETTDVERFFEKERDTLKEMRDRDHQHLIKAVAAYKKGPERCFVFPRAQGGSLRDFWRTHPAALDEQLVSWTIDQMIGLSDGLKQLHKFRTRHGDLKPDNILCFTYVNGSPHKWTLVLADVSLAKFHPAYTRDRTKYTRCVFLEFTIWLLYGRGGLALFHNTLFEKHMADGFWKNDPTQGPRLHPVAEDWIDKILNKDLKGDSALRALVELVVAKLLVPKIEQRATTRILCDELFNIQSTKGLFNSELRELAKHRGGSDFIAEDDMTHSSIERTSTLHNQWRNMTDSECALTLFRDRGSPTLRVCPSATPVISIYPDPASEHSAASDAQLGLPILPNCGSPQQFKLLNEWIYICDTAHNCTSYRALEGRIDSMPTRVIDVGTVESPCLRLVETGDSVRGKYIALSHCWGKLNKGQKFVTSASNLDSRKEGISFDEMPKSFQDAVRVTRALGVAYLWIDSLCIIQEDEADWQVESAKMEEVFSSAYCTIAASYAKSSLDGFLGDRTPRACVTIQHSQRPMFYLAEAIDDFQTHVEQSVLNSRGWVLQERALSRRTIHFTSTQVYWECGEGVYCETLTQLQK
ncbi:hypothetical protein CDV36_002983 [Fusarium kuroshium]|uniref:Protein kinase domain-containing protein n=1 Tax=Fusarium kuroshium TaxID=2010991 RepID=A0A3M2SJ85_9HYPO|nr:hypothetical protein CDV36_002983 [Fusarium kuroshium]